MVCVWLCECVCMYVEHYWGSTAGNQTTTVVKYDMLLCVCACACVCVSVSVSVNAISMRRCIYSELRQYMAENNSNLVEQIYCTSSIVFNSNTV